MVEEPLHNENVKAHADALAEQTWKDGAEAHDALQARDSADSYAWHGLGHCQDAAGYEGRGSRS